MSSAKTLSAIVMLTRAMFLTAGPGVGFGQSAKNSGRALGHTIDHHEATPNAISAKLAGAVAGYRVEPAGLSLLHPYVRGKIPVVLIHGLWSSPRSWTRMLEAFNSDPVPPRALSVLGAFGYSTGEPILYSAFLLRQSIQAARRQFDPEGTDPAFDRSVLIGYSMGGLLAKLMTQDSQSRLWEMITADSPEELAGPTDVCETLRRSFIFQPLPEIQRLIMIATPHRGSLLNQGAVPRIAGHFVRQAVDLKIAHRSLMTSNPPGFFREAFRRGLSTSITSWNGSIPSFCSSATW